MLERPEPIVEVLFEYRRLEIVTAVRSVNQLNRKMRRKAYLEHQRPRPQESEIPSGERISSTLR